MTLCDSHIPSNPSEDGTGLQLNVMAGGWEEWKIQIVRTKPNIHATTTTPWQGEIQIDPWHNPLDKGGIINEREEEDPLKNARIIN